jgi:hypothetical protein
VGLGGILEHQQAMGLGERLDGRHIAGLAIEMDGQHGRRARPDRRPGGVGIDEPRVGPDVAEDRGGPDVGDGQGRGEEGVAGHDDLVARADAVGLEHQSQRGGSRGDADAVGHLAVGGELRLERLELGAQRVGTGLQHQCERLLQLVGDAGVLTVKGDEAHG